MAHVIITSGFEADLAMVLSNKVLRQILDTIAILETIPSMGSTDIPARIEQLFGLGVHKIPVKPFDIVTLHDEKADSVTVLGLVHQRAAY